MMTRLLEKHGHCQPISFQQALHTSIELNLDKYVYLWFLYCAMYLGKNWLLEVVIVWTTNCCLWLYFYIATRVDLPEKSAFWQPSVCNYPAKFTNEKTSMIHMLLEWQIMIFRHDLQCLITMTITSELTGKLYVSIQMLANWPDDEMNRWTIFSLYHKRLKWNWSTM